MDKAAPMPVARTLSYDQGRCGACQGKMRLKFSGRGTHSRFKVCENGHQVYRKRDAKV